MATDRDKSLDKQRGKIGHNLKYDLLIFRQHGIEFRGLAAPCDVAGAEGLASRSSRADQPDWPACDSMVASYLIDSTRSSHAMDALALALLRRQAGLVDVPLEQRLPQRFSLLQRRKDTEFVDIETAKVNGIVHAMHG